MRDEPVRRGNYSVATELLDQLASFQKLFQPA